MSVWHIRWFFSLRFGVVWVCWVCAIFMVADFGMRVWIEFFRCCVILTCFYKYKSGLIFVLVLKNALGLIFGGSCDFVVDVMKF